MSIHSLDDIAGRRNGQTVLERLRWIDDRVQWTGGFRRHELMDRFSISAQQASGDIAMYQALAPGNAALDQTTKAYRRDPAFSPLFPKDVHGWLLHEAAHGSGALPIETIRMPVRHLDESVMAAVTSSFARKTALRITYQSLSSTAPSLRTICVHHVVDTGERLHLRAWDDKRKAFADFVVGRIAEAELNTDYPWVDGVADAEWSQFVDVVLGPQEGLSKAQRAAIELEFGMSRGKVAVSVRKALVVYLLARLGLLDSVRAGDSGPTHPGIRCLNPSELVPYLP